MPDEVRLPPHPASAGRARRFVVERLKELGVSDPGSAAELVVSELVTNAVMHAGTPITVRVVRRGSGARVEIADGSRSMPGLRSVSVAASSGRGLTLVEHFAAAWGVDPTDDGKVVWFVIDNSAKAAG